MSKVVLTELRSDGLPVVRALQRRGCTVTGFPSTRERVAINPEIDKCLFDGFDVTPQVKEAWDAVTGAIQATHKFIDKYKPIAAIVWNTVYPHLAGLVLACRARGVSTYEINHWRISTNLIGHFEDISLADVVFCSDEMAEFAKSRVSPSAYRPVGQVAYNGWIPRNAVATRRALGLPIEGKWVLVTSTWTHALTEWSLPEYNLLHIGATIRALLELQVYTPINVIWSMRGGDQGKLGNWLQETGIQNVFATTTEPIEELIDAIDVVVTQKSGVMADCVVRQRPCLVVDFKPNSDFYRFRGKGLVLATTPEEVSHKLLRLLFSPAVRSYIEKQQSKYTKWFGATSDTAERIADEVCQVF